MTGRGAEVAAVSALALVLTLAIAAPILRAPSDRIFGMEIVGRHHDPFTVMAQFRRPMSLGIYSQPLTDVPGALLARAWGPVAAYNWLVLLTFPLSAAAAYVLARHLTLAPAGAALAAIAFAFSPFHLAHAAYHPHIAQTQWMPLYFLALWRCLDDPTPRAIGLLAVSIVGVTLSNFYGGLIAAVMTPAAIAAYWFFTSRSHPGALRRLGITIGSLVVVAGGGAAYGWYAAHAVVVDRAAFGFARDDLFRYSAKWWSYVVPPVGHPVLGGFAQRVWNTAGVQAGLLEQQVSLGWGLVALGLVAIVSRDRHRTARAIVPVLATVAVVAFICSLSPERQIGPVTLFRPSAVLYSIVPMFRSYARFGVVVQLMAALLAGIGAERLWHIGTRRARIACVLLVALAAGEYAVSPRELWRDALPTPAHRWIARQPELRALDCIPFDPESDPVRWLTSDRIAPLGGGFDDCLEPNVPDKLSAAGYTHLLVRHGTEEADWFARGPLPTGLRVQGRFRRADLFAVTATAPSVFTASLTAFSPREHDRHVSWRWMGADAFWDVVNRREEPVVVALEIELWAFAHARRLELRIDGRVMQPLVIEQRRQTYRLDPIALSPGAHRLVFHPVDPPAVAGDYMKNGDPRTLSFAVGAWRWIVLDERP